MKVFASLLVALVASLSSPAFAQFAKPEDAVKYRQSALTVIAAHFGRIGAMASGRAPYDAKAATENAQVVADLARLPWAGFGPGTDKISQKAKPEIWKQAPKFKAAMDAFIRQANLFQQAAQSGNANAIRGEARKLGMTCKGCHDQFRVPEQH